MFKEIAYCTSWKHSIQSWPELWCYIHSKALLERCGLSSNNARGTIISHTWTLYYPTDRPQYHGRGRQGGSAAVVDTVILTIIVKKDAVQTRMVGKRQVEWIASWCLIYTPPLQFFLHSLKYQMTWQHTEHRSNHQINYSGSWQM